MQRLGANAAWQLTQFAAIKLGYLDVEAAGISSAFKNGCWADNHFSSHLHN
jgi:hypothetical protein